jgi:hypothetical protein
MEHTEQNFVGAGFGLSSFTPTHHQLTSCARHKGSRTEALACEAMKNTLMVDCFNSCKVIEGMGVVRLSCGDSAEAPLCAKDFRRRTATDQPLN